MKIYYLIQTTFSKYYIVGIENGRIKYTTVVDESKKFTDLIQLKSFVDDEVSLLVDSEKIVWDGIDIIQLVHNVIDKNILQTDYFDKVMSTKLEEFRKQYPMITSGDLQTFILGMKAIQSYHLKHQVMVEFDGEFYKIVNAETPMFVRSLEFQDEFEAALVYGLYLQYSKTKQKHDNVEFLFLIKSTFRIIGIKSNFLN